MPVTALMKIGITVIMSMMGVGAIMAFGHYSVGQ
jgi:hypothetical protein